MPHNRYFSSQPLTHDIVHLAGSEHDHLTKVMRKSSGDTIELIDGQGRLALAHVTEQDKQKSIIHIDSLTEQPPPLCRIKLVLACLKPSHLDFAIEKSVELGVDDIWIFEADRSEKKGVSENQRIRLNSIIIAATKQCGRLFLPKLFIKEDLQSCLSSTENALCLYGNPIASRDIHNTLKKQASEKKHISIYIGPEAGFSKREEELLSKYAQAVCFHENILRAETAAFTAVLYCQSLLS